MIDLHRNLKFITCLGQLFGVTLMATAGALSTYQYKQDQQEQYEQYLKDKEIRDRRARGEEPWTYSDKFIYEYYEL